MRRLLSNVGCHAVLAVHIGARNLKTALSITRSSMGPRMPRFLFKQSGSSHRKHLAGVAENQKIVDKPLAQLRKIRAGARFADRVGVVTQDCDSAFTRCGPVGNWHIDGQVFSPTPIHSISCCREVGLSHCFAANLMHVGAQDRPRPSRLLAMARLLYA
jgi:hypothetical protein